MTRTTIILGVWFAAISLVTLYGHTIEFFYPTGIQHVYEVFWGKLVLADFAASLVLISVWIAFLHPPHQRLSRGIAWGVVVVLLGTPAALFFFLLRARTHRDAQSLFLQPATVDAT